MHKAYFDTETTGFKPGCITQIAYILEDENFNAVEAKNFFFDIPDSEYDNANKAAEVTGLTADRLKTLSNGEKFKDRADEIQMDLHDKAHVAHNISFDENFLSAEMWRLNKTVRPLAKFDTMKIFTDICKLPNTKRAGFKFPKLEEVVNHYRLDSDKILKYAHKLFKSNDEFSYHDARYDVTCMYVICKVHAEEISGKLENNSWMETFMRKIDL